MENLKKGGVYTLLVIVGIFFLWWMISPLFIHVDDPSKFEESEKAFRGLDGQEIILESGWTGPYELPGGYEIFLREATVPYCVKNKNEEDACSKWTEDITGELPSGPQNKMLWFKHQGKKGKLRLVIKKM